MIYYLLLFVDFDSEASLVVENVVFILLQVINLPTQTAASGNYELSFCLSCMV